jgi:sulfate transport system ATP-binding protein
MTIQFKGISKSFGAFAALQDINLELPDGQLAALVGPSGSGKTTLLRILAGLETADGGEILISGGRDRRKVGFVFQHYALFKHMTVFENVAFGLKVQPRRVRPSRAELRERVQAILEMVQLGWAGPRMPDQLSGGQRQRVALARALAVEPEVLLLDEPFGALDAQVRADLRRWLRKLHDESGLTSVLVTHDQDEAMEVADRIVVLNRGRIEQDGTPQEVYEHPATAFVYQFLGQVNRMPGLIQDGHLAIGDAGLTVAAADLEEGSAASAYLRPHNLQIGLNPSPGSLPARVRRIQRAGPLGRIHLDAVHDGNQLEAHVSQQELARLALQPGQTVHILPGRLDVFPHGEDDWVI